MLSANWIRTVVYASAAIAVVIVWVSGGGVDIPYIKALVSASSVVTILALVFDSWAWRWPGIRRLSGRPIVHGTWKAELETSFGDRRDEAIECYLVVRQTYSRITVGMLFDRSSSRSMSGNLVFEDGACTLYYLFRTEAHALHQDGNPPRRGAAVLTVAREPRTHLEGDYWTERDTRGRIRTLGRSRVLFDTFSAAHAGTYE
jgi:hypothetical protein